MSRCTTNAALHQPLSATAHIANKNLLKVDKPTFNWYPGTSTLQRGPGASTIVAVRNAITVLLLARRSPGPSHIIAPGCPMSYTHLFALNLLAASIT